MVIEIKTVVVSGACVWRRGTDWRGTRGNVLGNGNVLYLFLPVRFMNMHNCENLLN